MIVTFLIEGLPQDCSVHIGLVQLGICLLFRRVANLHIALIQVGIYLLFMCGLNASYVTMLLDPTHNKLHDALIGMLTSGLANGRVEASFYLDFQMRLED